MQHGEHERRLQNELWKLLDQFCEAEAGTDVIRHGKQVRDHSSGITGGKTRSSALTIGMPGMSLQCWQRWAGRRLCWWPKGIPDGRRISLVSSRLKRQMDQEQPWFECLRTAVLRLDRSRDVICTVERRPPAANHVGNIVQITAKLFGMPSLRLVLHDPKSFCVGLDSVAMLSCSAEIATWLVDVMSQFQSAPDDDEYSCVLSPPVQDWDCLVAVDSEQAKATGQADGHDVTSLRVEKGSLLEPGWPAEMQAVTSNAQCLATQLSNMPLLDRLAMVVAERVCVLNARRGGNIDELIDLHLADHERTSALIHQVVGRGRNLFHGKAPGEMREGVIPWYLFSSPAMDHSTKDSVAESCVSDSFMVCGHGNDNDEIRECPLTTPEQWLTHWTRSRRGPWPEQSQEAWLEELILGCHSANRSALAVLLRILIEQQIRGSGEAIRGQHRVVSFTEVPLAQYRKMHRFRHHRQRFDFEPWGIAVRRQRLLQLGAKPVIYGNENLWKTMAVSDQPWFQKQDGPGTHSGFEIEREWRLSGDLHLSQCTVNDVVVFVDTPHAAHAVSDQTSFKVIVVP